MLAKNAIARWAPIAVDQAYPLAAQRGPDMYNDQLAAQQLAGWAQKAKSGGGKVYAWIYYFNDRNWLMPQPNWFNIVPDIELLAQSGVRGIFAEGVGAWVPEPCFGSETKQNTAALQKTHENIRSASEERAKERTKALPANALVASPTQTEHTGGSCTERKRSDRGARID